MCVSGSDWETENKRKITFPNRHGVWSPVKHWQVDVHLLFVSVSFRKYFFYFPCVVASQRRWLQHTNQTSDTTDQSCTVSEFPVWFVYCTIYDTFQWTLFRHVGTTRQCSSFSVWFFHMVCIETCTIPERQTRSRRHHTIRFGRYTFCNTLMTFVLVRTFVRKLTWNRLSLMYSVTSVFRSEMSMQCRWWHVRTVSKTHYLFSSDFISTRNTIAFEIVLVKVRRNVDETSELRLVHFLKEMVAIVCRRNVCRTKRLDSVDESDLQSTHERNR